MMHQSLASPFSFPVELFRPIVHYLEHDRAALCTVSLTSKLFQLEGQRVLYRRVWDLKTEADHIKFLTSIVDSERLALLVEAYSHHSVVNPIVSQGVLWDLGLRTMKNLKSLSFLSCRGLPSAAILRGCTFRLENLSWSCHSDEKELADNFLPFQHNLKQLHIESWRESAQVSISTSASPDLDQLGGSRGVIEAFLPGRKVTYLIWRPDEDDSSDDRSHRSFIITIQSTSTSLLWWML